jgi:hypothetical protein
MGMETIHHTTALWRWTAGDGVGWFFLTIDGDGGETLAATALMGRLETGAARGFGMIKVHAAIGETRWSTSVFPQKDGGWLLPVKAAIRRAEAISESDIVELMLEF